MKLARQMTPGALILDGAFSGDQNVLDLFAAGEPGWMYDNNDSTSLFSNVTGVTPAVVNGPVALQLDKSRGATLGSDQKNVGAVGLLGAATVATYDTSTGAGTTSRVNSTNQSYVEFQLTPWRWYKLDLTVSGGSGSVMSVRQTDTTVTAWAQFAIGSTTTVYVPTFADGKLLLTASTNGTTGSFTVNSVKSITGSHRYQFTSTSRPTLRGTPTGANMFASYGTPEAGWVDSGSGVATATATTGVIPTNVTPVIGDVYRVTWTVALTSGTVRVQMGGVDGATRTASGTYEMYVTAASTAPLQIDGVTSFTGTVSAIDVRNVSAGQVQAPYGLQFDGVDDYMQTLQMDFSSTDTAVLCGGMRKLSDAATATFSEFSASVSANNGSMGLFAPGSVASNIAFMSKGTGLAQAVRSGSTVAAPVTGVFAGVGDISTDTALLRHNGTQVATAVTDQGTGNYGSYAWYFGARGGASLRFNGLGFGGICVGRAVSARELDDIEQWVAFRTGVTF